MADENHAALIAEIRAAVEASSDGTQRERLLSCRYAYVPVPGRHEEHEQRGERDPLLGVEVVDVRLGELGLDGHVRQEAVETLHRERLGWLVLPADLAPGQWRLATADEVASIFTATESVG